MPKNQNLINFANRLKDLLSLEYVDTHDYTKITGLAPVNLKNSYLLDDLKKIGVKYDPDTNIIEVQLDKDYVERENIINTIITSIYGFYINYYALKPSIYQILETHLNLSYCIDSEGNKPISITFKSWEDSYEYGKELLPSLTDLRTIRGIVHKFVQIGLFKSIEKFNSDKEKEYYEFIANELSDISLDDLRSLKRELKSPIFNYIIIDEFKQFTKNILGQVTKEIQARKMPLNVQLNKLLTDTVTRNIIIESSSNHEENSSEISEADLEQNINEIDDYKKIFYLIIKIIGNEEFLSEENNELLFKLFYEIDNLSTTSSMIYTILPIKNFIFGSRNKPIEFEKLQLVIEELEEITSLINIQKTKNSNQSWADKVLSTDPISLGLCG